MELLINWIRDNFVAILVSAILPLSFQILQYRKIKGEAKKLDSESKKLDSETGKTDAETDGLIIKNANEIVTMWEGAYKELKEKTDQCSENNKTFEVKINYLQDSIISLKYRQKALLDFVSNILDAIKQTQSDVFAITDEKKVCLYISPNIFEVLGYSPLDFLNKNKLDFIHPDDRENFNEVFSYLLQFPEITSKITLRYKDRKGEYRWIESTIMNLLQTHVRGIFFSSKDVTKIKEAEAEFKNMYAELI